MKTKEKKTFRYSVSFTVETDRKMDAAELEEKAADVWDGDEKARKAFADSYGFTCVVLD